MTLHTNVPLHTRRRIAETGREQEAYMCLGVAGRGNMDEEDWLGVRTPEEDETTEGDSGDEDETVDEIDQDTFSLEEDDVDENSEIDLDGLPPLSEWEGKQLIATRCSNTGAVIEWYVVPFIVEDTERPKGEGNETVDEVAEEL